MKMLKAIQKKIKKRYSSIMKWLFWAVGMWSVIEWSFWTFSSPEVLIADILIHMITMGFLFGLWYFEKEV